MTSKVPFFSIIVSTHRRAAFLGRALRSLQAQTFRDFEVLVCADAIDADTGAVAAAMLSEGDTFLKHGRGRGPATSRNIGLQLARGDWVAFLDDDDMFRPHHLEVMHSFAAHTNAHALYSDCEMVVEDRSKPTDPPSSVSSLSLSNVPVASLFIKNFIPNNALVFRRSLLEGITVDAHLSSLEDWDFLLAVCARALPRHVPGGGAVVFKDYTNTGNRRGTQETSSGDTVLADFVHVYRRWPAPTPEIQQARQALLRNHGMELPLNWF